MINIRKLEAELWESADLLRAGSKLTSNQYCMPVLGLIFLRYAYSRYKMVEAEILKNRPSRGGRVMPVEASDFAAKPNAEPIYPDHDIIIMSDEAHRSQYGIFADNMMKLLPTAARMGFTGTPLLSSDNITARTFGGYVSVYDFKRAVEDGATVPLYYENRGEKILDLHNPEITEQILDAIENADLDVDQQDKLEAEFAKEIHLMTAEPRLKSIARDFVNHYSDLWTSGKAMFVCLNKVTCVRMYNYVQEYWN